MKIKYILTLVATASTLACSSAKEPISQKLAWVYQAEAESISKHDTLILLKWGKYGQKWNLASAPIVRDFIDQSVSADTFLGTSSKQLRQLTSIVYKMDTDAIRIEDKGVRKTIYPIVSHHKKGLVIYNELHLAVVNENQDKQLSKMNELVAWGKTKRDMFMPTYRRLTKVLPDELTNRTMTRLQNEVTTVINGDK